jgi:anaerobic magnesium-protoporphyrin IX monomethyl ester cyclase
LLSRFQRLPVNPRIVLVRPWISRWKLYKWYAPLGSHEPALGLLYIASYISSSGYNVHIVDGEILGSKDMLEQIYQLRPDIIGITSTTFSFSAAARLSGGLRLTFPDALLLMGGPHPSALPIETLEMVPSLDGVVVGEGEQTTLEIIQKRPTEEIRGLIWRNDTGFISNGLRVVSGTLDKFDLDWKLLEGFPVKYSPPFQSKKSRSASLIISRGCFYTCSFCASAALNGSKIQFHSPEYAIKLMNKLWMQYGISDFYFHDDYFPMSTKWISEFCIGLIRLDKKYSWSCASRVEALSDEILSLMKKSGCRQIGIGVESGSQKVLDRILKRISVTEMAKGLKKISQSGICIKGYFILDAPGETFIDQFKTLKFILVNNFSHIQFNYYAPLPGSPDYNLMGAPKSSWSRMSLQHCLGYSKIPSKLYWLIEISSYAAAYTKIIVKYITDELFNIRSKLSA